VVGIQGHLLEWCVDPFECFLLWCCLIVTMNSHVKQPRPERNMIVRVYTLWKWKFGSHLQISHWNNEGENGQLKGGWLSVIFQGLTVIIRL
jgi:hypothetical protein